MTRYPTAAALLVFAAFVAGCGPEKELPVDVQKAENSTGQQQVVPAQSEPEAKAVIDRAVKALTSDKPELLAKLKTSRVALKGFNFMNGPSQSIDAVRGITAVWPDRYHALDDLQMQGTRLLVETWLRRPDLVVHKNGEPNVPLTNLAEREQSLASDVLGQHWMPLLLPATDPKAVVFDLQSVTFESKALRIMKLSLGTYPLYQLTFDAKDALVRAEYTATDSGVPRGTTMIFSDHKPGPDGLVLPHRFECRHNNTVVERWTVEKWEFPAAIGDEQFSPPKKK